jgi:hypothetical protein
MSKLKMLCVFDGEEWVDTLRVYEVPCDGMFRYILQHIEDEDLLIFDSLEEVLEAAGRRVALGRPRIDKCP